MDHQWLATEFRSVVGAVVAPLDSPDMRDFRVTHVEAGPAASIRFSGAPTVQRGTELNPNPVDTTLAVQAIAWTLERRARRFAAGETYGSDPWAWSEELSAAYPGMFDCEVSPGVGWADLVFAMAERVTALNPDPLFKFTQVKSKFGTLRAYHQGFTDEISDLVDAFESASAGFCEDCGGPGRLRRTSGHWYRTACAEHADGADIIVGG